MLNRGQSLAGPKKKNNKNLSYVSISDLREISRKSINQSESHSRLTSETQQGRPQAMHSQLDVTGYNFKKH
jgi:hypothetical protein